MLRLNNVVKNKKRSSVSLSEASEPVQKLISVLEKIEGWIAEIPPIQQPSRFGNKAFRSWHSRLSGDSIILTASVTTIVPETEYSIEHKRSMDDIAEELSAYFATSFGNETRIDYGSGHEAQFLIFLFCLWKVGVFTEDDDEELVLLVFPSYLRVTRNLQLQYTLEPAGSKGVWGLDDYSFLPFLWGSAQLLSSKRIPPTFVDDDTTIAEHKDEYLYVDAIAFIKKMKTGLFWEHSSMLFDISKVTAGWPKINQGMIKMYKGEVWNKLPVVQHCLFGDIFVYENQTS